MSVIDEIAAERQRQIKVEGFDESHDDQEHADGTLALAAASYCQSAARPKMYERKPGCAFTVPMTWPQSWGREWWKPKDPRRDLIRAAALIVAEIEFLDRSPKRP